MPGRWYEQLFAVAVNQYGFVTSGDVRRLGGRPGVVVDMERAGDLERVAHGVYRFRSFPHGARDELMAATLWPRELGTISHDSALDLWDLCDVNPTRIHVTIPKAARIRRRFPGLYAVYQRNLVGADLSNVDGIAVVTPMRAILDGIERHLDGRLIAQAIDSATRRGLLLPDEIDRLTDTSR